MAQIKTPPISARTYRHFAAVTVAITAALAILADGENRRTIADGVDTRIAQRRETARIERAQVAKFGKPKLVRRQTPRSGDWGIGGYGDAFDASYGTPGDRTAEYARTAAVWRGRTGSEGKVPGAYAPYGIAQADWEAMSEQEREAWMRKMQSRSAPVSAEQRARDIESLMAASAERSGATAFDD
jgi:hypothetical protein